MQPKVSNFFLDFDKSECLKGKRILIVDDDDATLRILNLVLSPIGLTVETAQTVAAAREAIAQRPPDFLICDIRLPDQNGADLIQWVRSLPSTHGGIMPAIAFSADVAVETIQKSLDAGFQKFVRKPFYFESLVNEIYHLAQRNPQPQEAVLA